MAKTRLISVDENFDLPPSVQDRQDIRVSRSIDSAIDLTKTPEIKDAVGEWWIGHLATYLEAPYPRTVFGAISASGEILACEFNHATGKTIRTVCGSAIIDDHNVPSLVAYPNRRPIIAWTNHNGDNSIRLKVGKRSDDIAALAYAPEIDLDLGQGVSYTQPHLIENASTATLSKYWFFTRIGFNSWWIKVIDVNEITGDVTSGYTRSLLSGDGRQCYLSTANAYNSSGQQVIRCGFGFNPAQESNDLYYFEINTVTGAITGTISETQNVLTNTGFPLKTTQMVPALEQTAADTDRRFFYVRSGPDSAALSYAEWKLDAPEKAVYKVVEQKGLDSSDNIILGPGYLQSGDLTTKSAQWASGVRIETQVKLPTTLGEFEFRIGSQANPIVRFAIRPDGARVIRVRTDKSFIENSSTSLPFKDLVGKTVDIRVDINIAELRCRQYYSIDGGVNWVQIGSLGVDLAAGSTKLPVTASNERLIIKGSVESVNTVRISTFPNTSELVSMDASLWPEYTKSYTSVDGSVWTAMDGAYSGTTQKVNIISEFGMSGPSIESYVGNGAAVARNYIAGMAFETPSRDETVITAHSADGMEHIRKHRLTTDGFVVETLRSQPTSEGRLIRPYPPINGGPIPTLVTQINRYATFNDYDGDIVST